MFPNAVLSNYEYSYLVEFGRPVQVIHFYDDGY